ncbi:hypothetical protein QR680_012262 [Steinernema hermaphroditum]|uniref:Skp1-related protein n=1 Tax=Steinernema hermaphroditum TaxID=289476 RepID=A0AA39I3Z1_9BILA|nr:hypothetical protein QR680_012262 [Steinernema hermaphroditum]
MKKVLLESSDKESFEVDRDLVRHSLTLNTMLIDLGMDDDEDETTMTEAIPLQNVHSSTLRKVIVWLEHHRADPVVTVEESANKEKRTDDIPQWDQQFMKVDQGTLFDIILAANYLEIRALLDIGCKTVANMIKGKSPEQIRRTFNIKNDFTPEEEEQIRRENAWCED